MAITKLVIDLLTLIPRDEIIEKGIPYVRSISDKVCTTREDLQNWALFWEYFVGYWCSSRGFIETWNIIDEDAVYFESQNRTNNALERYKHSINGMFPTPNSSFPLFIQTIEINSRKQVERLKMLDMEGLLLTS